MTRAGPRRPRFSRRTRQRLRIARRVLGVLVLIAAWFSGLLVVPMALLGILLTFNTPEPPGEGPFDAEPEAAAEEAP